VFFLNNFIPPAFRKTAFNCPLCGAYAKQKWETAYKYHVPGYHYIEELIVAYCDHCSKYSIWYNEKMVYPFKSNAPLPNPDLPNDIKRDYEEARSIVTLSPRGASALLRLAIQKLCKHLGEKGENINNDIANLMKSGLSPKIQKSLDIVRVIGNEAVHPGQIDLNDNNKIAMSLFNLVNIIANEMITQPKEVDNLYDALPKSKREAITERDKKSN